MSLAEFGFVSLAPGYSSARHDWKDSNVNTKSEAQRQREEKETAERLAREEAAEKEAAEQLRKNEEEAKAAEDERLRMEEEEEERLNRPWWQKYADKYQGSGKNFHIGETTPPPEDDGFPNVYSMTNGWSPAGGINVNKPEPKTKPEQVMEPEEVKIGKAKVVNTEEAVPMVLLEQEPEIEPVKESTPEKPELQVKEPVELLKEEVKMGKAKVVNTEEAVPMVLVEEEPEIEPVKESTPEKQPYEKKILSGLAEKILAKSGVKKLKAKMAVIKKSAPKTINDEASPNTEEGVRPTINWKRPLKDKGVEGQQDCRKVFCYCLVAFLVVSSVFFSILVQIYWQ
jgi:hypothetical protein